MFILIGDRYVDLNKNQVAALNAVLADAPLYSQEYNNETKQYEYVKRNVFGKLVSQETYRWELTPTGE